MVPVGNDLVLRGAAFVTFPWETSARSTEETVAALQRDIAYVVSHTAVLVHSKHPALAMLVNTPRGQRMPRGECRLSDESMIEFQDIGMPQVGSPEMSVIELVKSVYDVVQKLGLEMA